MKTLTAFFAKPFASLAFALRLRSQAAAAAKRRPAASLVLGLALSLVPTLIAAAAITTQRGRQVDRSNKTVKQAAQKEPLVDYAHFSHRTHVTGQKLACDTCHKFPSANWKDVRPKETAFADVTEFPQHAACLQCHREQFFARQRPAPLICSNCHVNNSPRDTTRFLFPSLGDVADTSRPRRDFVSEFQVNFPHDKHMEVLGSNQQPAGDRGLRFVRANFQKGKAEEEKSDPKTCVMCHHTYQPQGDSSEEYVTKPPKNLGDAFWLKKGTFKTIPVSHAPCSTCHSTDGGIDPVPSKCEVCHKLLPAQPPAVDFDAKLAVTMNITDRLMLTRWQRRESSGTFPHDGGAHPALACTTCHNIPTMNTVEPKSLKVAVKSCAGADGCHITATADDGGALNYEIDQRKAKADFQCTKCHLAFGNQPLPASHLEAIPKPVKKP
jgi:hypothetical protein